ncbi:MAG: hypothetical protein ACK4NW_05190 [Roseinatronobacter sp.]
MSSFTRYPALLRATVAATFLAAPGTSLLADSSAQLDSNSPVRAVFTACHDRFGCEPWITDGTREGTELLRNLRRDLTNSPPLQNSGWPHYISDLGDGRIAFTASHRTAAGHVSWEPFISDGTRENTSLVRRIGESGTSPRGYTGLGDGRFIFTGRNPDRGWAPCIWVSDGSRRSTTPVVCSDWHPHLPNGFARLREGEAIFSMNDGRRGWELWITDGTRAGTRIVQNLTGDDRSSTPQEIVQLADGLAFFIASAGMLRELWVTDGTRRGTLQLTEIPSSTVDNRPKHLTAIGGGRALFNANFQLWITDGTPEGTHPLPDDRTRVTPGGPMDFTPLGDGRVCSPPILCRTSAFISGSAMEQRAG